MNKQSVVVDDIWCDPLCPFFKFDSGYSLNAVCEKLNKQLYFYDWFIAECQEEDKGKIS